MSAFYVQYRQQISEEYFTFLGHAFRKRFFIKCSKTFGKTFRLALTVCGYRCLNMESINFTHLCLWTLCLKDQQNLIACFLSSQRSFHIGEVFVFTRFSLSVSKLILQRKAVKNAMQSTTAVTLESFMQSVVYTQ